MCAVVCMCVQSILRAHARMKHTWAREVSSCHKTRKAACSRTLLFIQTYLALIKPNLNILIRTIRIGCVVLKQAWFLLPFHSFVLLFILVLLNLVSFVLAD